MGEIAYQNKDIISKYLAETLKEKSLAVFGMPGVKIIQILPTNLPAVEANELRLDNLFQLSDNTYMLLDYESAFRIKNKVKYINHVARFLKRLTGEQKLNEDLRIRYVVVYTADVAEADAYWNVGCLEFEVEQVFLIKKDTNRIYENIRKKISENRELADDELMELMILPLTVKGKSEKQKWIKKTVELSHGLKDEKQELEVLAGLLVFTDKIIDKDYAREVESEIMMTKVEKLMYKDILKRVKEDLQKEKEAEMAAVRQQLTQQVTKELTKQVTREVTEEVTAEVTSKVTAEVTSKVTAEVTSAVTNKLKTELAGKLTGLIDDETLSLVLELPLEQVASITAKAREN